MATAEVSRRVVLGRIVGAHGVRGWLKIASYTEPAENLLQHPRWMLCRGGEGGAEYRLRDAEHDGRWLRVRLEGIDDRDAAELLRGMDIEVARTCLPPLAAREHYREDLLGMAVRNLGGALLGSVSHFVEGPAYAVMVVRSASAEYWVPAAPPHLVRVESGQIVVDWTAESQGGDAD